MRDKASNINQNGATRSRQHQPARKWLRDESADKKARPRDEDCDINGNIENVAAYWDEERNVRNWEPGREFESESDDNYEREQERASENEVSSMICEPTETTPGTPFTTEPESGQSEEELQTKLKC